MRTTARPAHALHGAAVRLRQGNLTAALRNRWLQARGQPRRLLPVAAPTDRHSSRRLNALVTGLVGATRYLEIGLASGTTFETVRADRRVGVDPEPAFAVDHLPQGSELWHGTSDDYFASLDLDERFDVVFADGLHEYEQTYRDVVHAVQHLEPGGVVLVDDVVPTDEISALRDPVESRRRRAELGLHGTPWHGDVFVVLRILRDHHPELAMRVIVDSGNDQALLWRSDDTPTEPVSASTLAGYGNLTYADVFARGVPDWCRPGAEQEVLAEALTCSNARRGAAKP